jgi:hypothetical protein
LFFALCVSTAAPFVLVLPSELAKEELMASRTPNQRRRSALRNIYRRARDAGTKAPFWIPNAKPRKHASSRIKTSEQKVPPVQPRRVTPHVTTTAGLEGFAHDGDWSAADMAAQIERESFHSRNVERDSAAAVDETRKPRILRTLTSDEGVPHRQDIFAEAKAAQGRAAAAASPGQGYTTVEMILNTLLDAPNHELSNEELKQRSKSGRDFEPHRYLEAIRELRRAKVIQVDQRGKRGHPGADALVKRVVFGAYPPI